jgi:ABC-type Zn uptake system ZnuABC Zn-binding protein ZnuA
VSRLPEEKVKRVALLAIVLVTAAACAGRAQPSPDSRLQVVTTTTVFADLVSRVGGNLVSVYSLVPRGTDVHTFDPTPADVQTLSTARLIVMNGLGLDDWLTSVIRDGGAANTPLLNLAESVPGAQLIANGQAEGDGSNPHLWMDVTYARAYAAAIAAELIQLDPQNKPGYDASLATYDTELRDLDAWIRSQIGPLPPDSRKITAFHDALPYYARAYGLQLVDTIASQTGAKVVRDLYDDSLGDSPIDSYEAAMRWDTNQITRALK